MVELIRPVPTDIMCDPPAALAAFPWRSVNISGGITRKIFRDAKLKAHFHHGLFHAFDFDNTMLRIGSMNMLLHGVENPDIRYRTPSRRTTPTRWRNIL